MEAACPLLRFVNYDEPKTKREIYKSHFKAKIKRFSSDKIDNFKSLKDLEEWNMQVAICAFAYIANLPRKYD